METIMVPKNTNDDEIKKLRNEGYNVITFKETYDIVRYLKDIEPDSSKDLVTEFLDFVEEFWDYMVYKSQITKTKTLLQSIDSSMESKDFVKNVYLNDGTLFKMLQNIIGGVPMPNPFINKQQYTYPYGYPMPIGGISSKENE